jgi:hypothetical protein
MVQFCDINTHLFCVYVRFCECIRIATAATLKLTISFFFQAQLVPQLIINYKLKVTTGHHHIPVSEFNRITECSTYANEGYDIQDFVDGCRRFLCVRLFS